MSLKALCKCHISIAIISREEGGLKERKGEGRRKGVTERERERTTSHKQRLAATKEKKAKHSDQWQTAERYP